MISPEDLESLRNDRSNKDSVKQCLCETDMTCWVHHDCRDGDCTHIDGAEG